MTQDEIIRMAREAGSIDSEDVIETVWAAFAAAEQAEQEPVAIDWEKAHEVLCDVWNRVISADDGFDVIQDMIYAAPLAKQDTHATHVVRTKDLTDDEIRAVLDKHCGDGLMSIAYAVIAADRKLNGVEK